MNTTTEALQFGESQELKEFQSVLKDWSATRFFFEEMKEEFLNRFAQDPKLPEEENQIKSLLANEPRHVSAELKFQKETFSKLKFNYLEQETKEKFLKRILDITPKFVNAKDVKELEQRVQEHKTALKEKKKTAEDLKQQLQEVALLVVEAHQKLSLDFNDAMELVQSIQDLQNEMKQIEESNALEQIQNARTKEESAKLLAQQAKEIEELEVEVAEWQAKVLAAEGEVNMVETTVGGLQTELASAQSQVQEAERVAKDRDLNLEHFAVWLDNARRVLGTLTGVESITVKPPASLHLGFKTQKTWNMIIEIHSERADNMVEVHIPNFPVPLVDILYEVNRKSFATTSILRGRRLEEMLPMAVYECIDRVSNWEKRQVEFEKLAQRRNRWDFKVLDNERILVALRPSRAQLIFTVDQDYPKSLSCLNLVDVNNVTGRHDDVLFKHYHQHFIKSKSENLTQLLDEMENLQGKI